MFAIATLLNTLTLAQLLRGLLMLSLLTGLVMLFRPLIKGFARAAVLAVRPRLSQEQLEARRHLDDSAAVQRMINAAAGPDDAAELRALASRG